MTLTLVIKKGFYPKEYICKSSFTYNSKAMENVKVFADKQTDGQRDRPKTICP